MRSRRLLRAPEPLIRGNRGTIRRSKPPAGQLTLLDPAEIFTDTVNMILVSGENVTLFNGFDSFEKVLVTHVAYACGCVRTFRAEEIFTEATCKEHGDPVLSTTQEYRLPEQVA